jgi:hypothetical protein
MGLFGCGAQSWLSIWWLTGISPSTQALADTLHVHVYVHSQDYTRDLADCQLCRSYYLPVERKQVGVGTSAGLGCLKLCASVS